MLERGGHAAEFVERHTEGFTAFKQQVESTTWEEIETSAGVPGETIARVAEMYMSATNAVIGWTMGITHHLHGVENVQMIANLALLRGMIGRPHAGLLPIRGHSNVQGMGSVGVTPVLKQAILARLEERLGIRGPDAPWARHDGLHRSLRPRGHGHGGVSRRQPVRKQSGCEVCQSRRLAG